jgi:hypothetical protein
MSMIPYADLIGAGVNAGVSAIGQLGYANTQQRKMMKADVQRMQRGDLGYSEAQRNQLLAGQNRVGQAQMADQMAQMQRYQASQPGGRAGGYDTQRGQLLAGRQAATAQYNTGVEQASSQMAGQQRAEIMSRLAAQGQKFTEAAQRQGDIAQSGISGKSVGGEGGGGSGYSDVLNKFNANTGSAPTGMK